MKRGGYIKRRTTLRPRREKPRRNEVVDEAYLAWVRRQACCCGGRDPRCHGEPIQAHHTIKGNDHSAIPLSRWCHLEGRHGGVGGRKGWLGSMPLAVVKEWERGQVVATRTVYLAQCLMESA